MSAQCSKFGPPSAFTITDSTQLEDWKKWQRSFRYYANAINLDQKSHDFQLSTFKSLIGPDALEIYNTFSILDITDVESVMQKFDEHFKPKVNKTVERYKLYKLHQSPEQKFDEFLSEITNQVNKCDFKSFRDEIILYKIVGGILNEEIRSALLEEDDLKYDTAIQICRASSTMHFMSGSENVKGQKNKSSTVVLRDRNDLKAKTEPSAAENDQDDSPEGGSDAGSDWRADNEDPDSNDDEVVIKTSDPSFDLIIKKSSSKKKSPVKKKRKRRMKLVKGPVMCDICGHLVDNYFQLRRHMATHNWTGKVSCYYCGKEFNHKRYMIRHLSLHHAETIGKPAPVYSCDVCDYKTSHNNNMRRHKFQHTDERPYSCELCAYQCIVPRLMKEHMAKHTGQKPLSCSECGKGFITAAALKNHGLTHLSPEEREKKLECNTCETCGKTFSQKSALKTHQVIHSGERPFACNFCDYRGKQRSAFHTHMLIHNDEKPFVCTVCGYACRQRQILSDHMLIHTGDKPHSCPLCPSKFRQSSHLNRHMKVHTGEKPFVCDICGHRWTTQSNLRQHMRVHKNQSGDPTEYSPPRKRKKKTVIICHQTTSDEPTPAAIPQWSEQVSTINPMECFPNMTPSPFHPPYSANQGNQRPPDCRYYQ